jgi:hypothetical protein
VRGTGGYVISPTSARLDGKIYTANRHFKREAIADAPGWLYDLLSSPHLKPNGESSPRNGDGNFPPTALNRKKLASALNAIPADERELWLRVGAALNSLEPDWGGETRTQWDKWSMTSTKFDQTDQDKTWEGFDPGRPFGVMIGTIFFEAKARGWTPPHRGTTK